MLSGNSIFLLLQGTIPVTLITIAKGLGLIKDTLTCVALRRTCASQVGFEMCSFLSPQPLFPYHVSFSFSI